MAESNPWFLVIEALLHMQQVDLSIILDLIKSVPDVCDDLGRNVRDLLAIRVLEDLYSRQISNEKSSSLPRTEMDVSRFCEEVVKLILGEACPVNQKFDEKHVFDLGVVRSFILQKRSSMQICSLQRLKNGILEGSDPILNLLKDRSGLKVPDENSRIPIPGDVSNGIAEKHGVCRNSEAKRKLTSYTAEDDEISGENQRVNKLSPAKRVRNIAVARNGEGLCPEPCGTFEESSQKLKTVLLCFPKRHRELAASACQHEKLGDSSSRTVKHIEEPVDRETGAEVHSVEERKGKEDHCANASARIKKNIDIDPGVVFKCQRLVPYADSTSEDMSGEEDARVIFSDKTSGGNECASEPPAVTVNVSSENIEENGSSKASDSISHRLQNNVNHAMNKDDRAHGHNLELASDSGEYHDVRTDIEMTKNSFLSSQGIDTQDSLGTQLDSCVKCNQGGNVLCCSSSSCPLVVHEECLGSANGFDRTGNFYCPFCAYQQTVSRYQEAKKKFSLVRTDLTTFYVFRADLEEKSFAKRSPGSKKHGSCETQNINDHIEPTNNHDLLNEDIGNLIPPSKLDEQVGGPSKSSPRVEAPCGEIEPACSRDQEVIPAREMHIPNENIGNLMSPSIFDEQVEEPSKSSPRVETPCGGNEKLCSRDQEVIPAREMHNRNEDIVNLIPANILDGQVGEPSKSSPRVETPCGENDNSCSRDQEVVPGRETQNRKSEKKELPCQSDSDVTCAPKCTDSNAGEGCNAKCEKNDVFRYCLRPRKLGRQIKDPIAQLRKKLSWKNVEEQTLKTWEFNPVDPNEKWSNIFEGSPRSK